MSQIPLPDLEFTDTDSFEKLCVVTRALLTHISNQALDDVEIQAVTVQLLKVEKGPRAFFATLLTDSGAIADHPPAALISALGEVPTIAADLLVKNLAMSTAMLVHHRRQNNDELAQGSSQVQQRSQQLLLQLTAGQITRALESLQASLQGQGDYTEFLARWGYDAEQKRTIADCVESILSQRPSES